VNVDVASAQRLRDQGGDDIPAGVHRLIEDDVAADSVGADPPDR
jgi:hypothetical protein